MRLWVVIIAGSFVILLGVVGWVYMARTASPAAPTSSPAGELTPLERQQNAEQLIEVRSQNVKNRLDQTREQAQQYQNTFNDALLEE